MTWEWLTFCFLFLTAMVVYFPTIYIRKTDRMLQMLEGILRNTQDAAATARDIARVVIPAEERSVD
jgi:hypothetical protein